MLLIGSERSQTKNVDFGKKTSNRTHRRGADTYAPNSDRNYRNGC